MLFCHQHVLCLCRCHDSLHVILKFELSCLELPVFDIVDLRCSSGHPSSEYFPSADASPQCFQNARPVVQLPAVSRSSSFNSPV